MVCSELFVMPADVSLTQNNVTTLQNLKCMALVWAVQKFRPYLYGRHFVIVSDNSALVWLQTKKDLTHKLMRWAIMLQEYDRTLWWLTLQ